MPPLDFAAAPPPMLMIFAAIDADDAADMMLPIDAFFERFSMRRRFRLFFFAPCLMLFAA